MSIRRWSILAAFMISAACALAVFTPPLSAAEPDAPNWSLEVKGGMFYPEIDGWQTYYGDRKTGHFAGALAYKIFRQLEVGVEGGYIRDSGQGLAPLHSDAAGVPVIAGDVTYELFPLQAFALLRLVFSENQWLVPYVGGGWTRMYYREKIEFQDTVKGSFDGYHGRAGLQFLLDGLDRDAANSFYLEYGVTHTYIFVEAQKSRVMVDNSDLNLGGTSFLAGFLFEF